MGRPKITYNSIDLNFPEGAGAQNLEILKKETIGKSTASSGKRKHLHFFQDQIIRFDIPYYARDFENELLRLYDYCRTGQTCKLILNSDIGMYLPFEGKTLESSDGDSGTFARSGVANTIDPYTGLVTSVATGTPRFQAGKFTGASFLNENAMPNLLDNTENFDHADWVDDANLTISASTMKDPEGDVTSKNIKFTSSGTNAATYQGTATAINNTSATFSVWIKCLSGTVAVHIVMADDAAAVLVTKGITATTEWVRHSVSYTDSSANGNNWRPVISIDISGKVIFAWGAQLEINTHSTSYLSDQATRNIESFYNTLGTDNINQSTWSVSFWLKTPYDHDELDATKIFTWITQSTTSNRFASIGLLANGNFEIRAYDFENNANEIAPSADGHIVKDTWKLITVTCDATASSSLKLYVDGVLVETDNNSAFSPSNFDRLYIGSSATPSLNADAMIDDFIVFNRVLTVTEILNYYNSGIGWGIAQNIWDNVYLNNYNWKTEFLNGVERRTATLEFINQLT